MFCGAWQIFCLGFVVVQVVFLVKVLFFQEESQLLSLQCYQNQSCHSWPRQEMSWYLQLHIFCVVYKIVSSQQVHQLPCHHHHIVHPQMLRLHLCSTKVYHLVFHTKTHAVHYHELVSRKVFHQNPFLYQKLLFFIKNSSCKIQLLLVKRFFLTFLIHYLSCNLK